MSLSTALYLAAAVVLLAVAANVALIALGVVP